MAYANSDVLHWWVRGWKLRSQNMYTTGGELYSYGHRIGVTVDDKRYIWRVVEPVISSASQRTAMRHHFMAASRTGSRLTGVDGSVPLEIPQASDPYGYIRNLSSGEPYSSMTDEGIGKTEVVKERFTYGKELDELMSQVLVRSLNNDD
jgi:hypothetical protein